MSYMWVILAGVGEGGTFSALLVADVAQNSGGGWNYYYHIAMDDRSSYHSLGHSQVPGTESPVAELGMRCQEWMPRPRMDAAEASRNGALPNILIGKHLNVSACYTVIIVALIIFPYAGNKRFRCYEVIEMEESEKAGSHQ